MITVLRDGALRIVIFVDDHEPAHVHVFGDGEAKVNLVGNQGVPELVWAVGMKRSELRRAMAVVTDNRDTLLVRWRDIHG